jgi:Leucine-rich repeat (LRR) protein
LRTLLLSYNKITDIEIIWQEECLQDLEILDVSSNQISNISDAVFNKYSLNYLNFENNNLSKLPTVLGFMKLLGLKVDGNPLKLIKRQVIEKGTVAIMEFLKNKHQGDPPARIGQREVFSGHQEETEENYYQEEPKNYQRPEPPRHRPPVREENMEVKQSKEEQAKMVASLEKEMKILEQ